MKALLTTIALFISTICFSQVTAIHFNADWNEANNVEWFNKLSDVEKESLDISDNNNQTKHSIAIVPTIIIFDDGEEVKRFQADLSFKMVATKKEIQEYIDELIISKF
jgi:hypothetical protein